jgi:hypothetical protein
MTIQNIAVEDRRHNKYVSDYLTIHANLSPQAYMIHCILSTQYKHHKYTGSNVIEVYSCFDAYLKEKTGISKRDTLKKYKDELVEKGLLFSKQKVGNQGCWYVPLDPADTDYPRMVDAVNLWLTAKELSPIRWVTEATVSEPEAVTQEVEASALVVDETPLDRLDRVKERLTIDGHTFEVTHDGVILLTHATAERLRILREEVGNPLLIQVGYQYRAQQLLEESQE